MKKPLVVMMTVPLPCDIRLWIEEKATENLSPMSSAIVVALRQQMRKERREAAAS